MLKTEGCLVRSVGKVSSEERITERERERSRESEREETAPAVRHIIFSRLRVIVNAAACGLWLVARKRLRTPLQLVLWHALLRKEGLPCKCRLRLVARKRRLRFELRD